MKKVRMGVIGCGGMARHHLKYLNEIPGCEVTALADSVPESLEAAAKIVGDLPTFDDGNKLLKSGKVDAVLIATPHYHHPVFTKAAMKQGIHVLTEKPVAVTAKAAAEVNKLHEKHPDVIYGAMFQQRTLASSRKIKELIETGQLGEIQRVNWTITTWFRTQAYYNSGGWRATWEGEGGGVLLNQCPHNLDLIQWFVGMPEKVTAHIAIGKYHRIEVEDEVTAYLEYPNGATGVFMTSTGEAPGINRLDIVGTRATLSHDGGAITLIQNETPADEFCRTSQAAFATPDKTVMTIDPKMPGGQHRIVTEQFIAAIQQKDPALLVATGDEGINGLELGNAMLMSGLTGETVKIPTPRTKFDKLLKDLVSKSTFKKDSVKKAKADLGASF